MGVDSAQERTPHDRFAANIRAIRAVAARRLGMSEPSAAEHAAAYSGWADARVRNAGFDAAGVAKPELVDALAALAESGLAVDHANLVSAPSLSAYLTPAPLAEAIVRLAVVALGRPPSAVLEPSAGTGRFLRAAGLAAAPGATLVAVEPDAVLGATLAVQHCQPAGDWRLMACPLELAGLRAPSFDLVVGNVPFGEWGVSEPDAPPEMRRRHLQARIHDYVVCKAVSLLREGGVAALITHRSTLDRKETGVREWLWERAELIGAWRLPSELWAPQGAAPVADLLLLRRRTTAGVSPPPLATVRLAVSAADGEEAREAIHEVSSLFTTNNPDTEAGHLLGAWDQRSDGRRDELAVRWVGDVSALDGVCALLRVAAEWLRARPVEAPPRAAGALGVAAPASHPAEADALALYAAVKASLSDVALRAEAVRLHAEFRARWGGTRAALCGILSDAPVASRREAALLLALEHRDGRPSVLLELPAPKASAKPTSARDALLVALDQHGRVSVSTVAELLGKSRLEARALLLSEGAAFEVPPGCPSGDSHTIGSRLVPASEYLTGDVRAKLRVAERAAAADRRYAGNVVALVAALPPPLGPEEVSVGLGAEWVPPEIYRDFLYSLFPGESWGLAVEWAEASATWRIECSNPAIPKADEALRTPRVRGLELIEAALNSKMPVVEDEVRTADGPRKVRNEAATMEAQARVQELRQRFEGWVFGSQAGKSGETSQARSARLCELYNERFNSVAPRDFDGSYLTFPGLADTVRGLPYILKPRQARGVAKVLAGGTYDRSALFPYTPGFGKTDPAICAAVKLTQLGLARRTLFAVPKNAVEQWRARFGELFPGLVDEVLSSTDPRFGIEAQDAAAGRTYRDALAWIPRDQIAEVEQEERDVAARIAAGESEDSLRFYWRVPSIPKELPRRLYFGWDDAIRAWHDVAGAETVAGASGAPEHRLLLRVQVNSVEPVPARPRRGLVGWSESGRGPTDRDVFLSQVAGSGWRYVIVSHEMLREFLLSERAFEVLVKRELSELRASLREAELGIGKESTRQARRSLREREGALERSRVGHRRRWEELRARCRTPVSWEDCGIDHLVLDEVQAFKRLGVATKMERVAGLPSGESARAYDTFCKVRTVLASGGRVTALTGTPLTNTLAESFVWMKVLQPGLLARLGLEHFDAFASVFFEAFPSVEMDCVGKFRSQTRLRFRNVPELVALLGECWDYMKENA
jgi:N12 class adenine-specific DNA methylase